MGWGNLRRARDLRAVMRLDDQREHGAHVQVHAAVLTTHDLALPFALTEIVPGFLPDPTAVPSGVGPGNRSARGPLLDLPPVAIVYAPEASVACDVPWRPPAVDLCPYFGARRQHTKVAAILYSRDEERMLRLLASSANLTRRAFATNLEVAAFEDYALGGRRASYPSLFELRLLLVALAEHSPLEEARAYDALLDELPERAGRASRQQLHFVHSVERTEYAPRIAEWLTTHGENCGEYERAVIVSPFFSAQGERLHQFFRDDLEFGAVRNLPIEVVVDGRPRSADATATGSPYTTPPAWLWNYCGDGSTDYRPAVIAMSREDEPRGTREVGRPLHAKVLALGYERARARNPRHVWRMLIGSSNFTLSGYGLTSPGTIEAGFFVEHEELEAGDFFGEQERPLDSLCVEHDLEPDPDREEIDFEEELEEAAVGKSVLACLAEEGAVQIDRLVPRGFQVTVDLSDAEALPDAIFLGHEAELTEDEDGVYSLQADSLAPYYLLIRCGDATFQWPLQVDAIVEEVLTADAGLHRRRDRLLEYWLRQAGQPHEPDEEDFEDDPGLRVAASGSQADDSLGSWALNRLLLGVRRRLAESVGGVGVRLPAPEQLLATVRARELIVLATGLSDSSEADALYFGTLVRACLLGYWAGTSSRRTSWADAKREADVLGVWEREQSWKNFEAALRTARKTLGLRATSRIDAAAEALYDSVRRGELSE